MQGGAAWCKDGVITAGQAMGRPGEYFVIIEYRCTLRVFLC